jgi:hypothetical protein
MARDDLLIAASTTALVEPQGSAFTLDLARNGTIDLKAISVERLELTGKTLSFSGSVAATALARGGVTFMGTAEADTLDGSLRGWRWCWREGAAPTSSRAEPRLSFWTAARATTR